MNNDLDASSTNHIYKPNRWTMLLNIFSVLFVLIIMGLPFTALIFMFKSLIQEQTEFGNFAIILGCLFAPIIIMLGLTIIQILVNAILASFSYIRISSSGIEQKYPIYKHIQCRWPDVDRIGKLFLMTDVLYLNSFEVIGPSISLKSPFKLLRPKQGFITLAGFEGWPTGRLAQDLKLHAPQLFMAEPVLQEGQPEKIDPEMKPAAQVDPNQESRLLAALSHASVLFSSPGIIVPIVVYATQRKKSSFIAFQTLQALILQIASLIFTMLISACLVAAIFIPILFVAVAQDARVPFLSSGGMVVMMTASVFLMIFGNLAFIIYGIIGAIMSYRGKDFRYVLIARQIEKRKSS